MFLSLHCPLESLAYFLQLPNRIIQTHDVTFCDSTEFSRFYNDYNLFGGGTHMVVGDTMHISAVRGHHIVPDFRLNSFPLAVPGASAGVSTTISR